MITAPYGIFALLAALVVESPSLDLFQALGMYAITLIIGLVVLIVVYIILVNINIATKTNLINLFQILWYKLLYYIYVAEFCTFCINTKTVSYTHQTLPTNTEV